MLIMLELGIPKCDRLRGRGELSDERELGRSRKAGWNWGSAPKVLGRAKTRAPWNGPIFYLFGWRRRVGGGLQVGTVLGCFSVGSGRFQQLGQVPFSLLLLYTTSGFSSAARQVAASSPSSKSHPPRAKSANGSSLCLFGCFD